MGRMYGVQNGQDDVTYGGTDVHNDNPGEIIARLDAGSHHGYPFCFVVQRVNSLMPGTLVSSEIFAGNTRDDAWCQTTTNVTKPVTFIQAHSAPMDITFFHRARPATCPRSGATARSCRCTARGTAAPATGYRVIWVPFNADGTAPMPTTSGSTTTFPYEVVLSAATPAAPRTAPWNVSGGEQNVAPGGRRRLAGRRRALHLVRFAGLRLPRRPDAMTQASDGGRRRWRLPPSERWRWAHRRARGGPRRWLPRGRNRAAWRAPRRPPTSPASAAAATPAASTTTATRSAPGTRGRRR